MAKENLSKKNQEMGKKLKKSGIVALCVAIISVGMIMINNYNTTYPVNYNDGYSYSEKTTKTSENNQDNAFDNYNETNNEETEFVNNDRTNKDENNQELMSLYDTATNDISILMDDLDLDNEYEYFYTFYELLNNGTFSKDNTYTYTDDKLIDNVDALGYDVLTGKGVCRNTDALFTDVASKNGYEAISIPCYADTSKDAVINSNKPNHQICFFDINGDIKGFDTTNHKVIEKYYEGKNYFISSDGQIYYRLYPEASLRENKYLTRHNTQDEIYEFTYNISDDNKTNNNSYIENKYINALENLESKQVLVNDFKVKYQDEVLDNLVTYEMVK